MFSLFWTLQTRVLTVSPLDHLAAVLEPFVMSDYDLPRQPGQLNLLVKFWSFDWERIARAATEIHLVWRLFFVLYFDIWTFNSPVLFSLSDTSTAYHAVQPFRRLRDVTGDKMFQLNCSILLFLLLFFSPYSLTNIWVCCSAPRSIWPTDTHKHLHMLTVSAIHCWQLVMWRPCVFSTGTNSAVAETVQRCLGHTCSYIDTLHISMWRHQIMAWISLEGPTNSCLSPAPHPLTHSVHHKTIIHS